MVAIPDELGILNPTVLNHAETADAVSLCIGLITRLIYEPAKLADGYFALSQPKRLGDSHAMLRTFTGNGLDGPLVVCRLGVCEQIIPHLVIRAHQKLARRDEEHRQFDIFAIAVLAKDNFSFHLHAKVLGPGGLMCFGLIRTEGSLRRRRGIFGDTFRRPLILASLADAAAHPNVVAAKTAGAFRVEEQGRGIGRQARGPCGTLVARLKQPRLGPSGFPRGTSADPQGTANGPADSI